MVTKISVDAYEFSALLRLGTTYELMDFPTRAQVFATTLMAKEHAETKMIQPSAANDRLKDAREEPSTAHGDTRLKHGTGGGIPRSEPHVSRSQANGAMQQDCAKASTTCHHAMAGFRANNRGTRTTTSRLPTVRHPTS